MPEPPFPHRLEYDDKSPTILRRHAQTVNMLCREGAKPRSLILPQFHEWTLCGRCLFAVPAPQANGNESLGVIMPIAAPIIGNKVMKVNTEVAAPLRHGPAIKIGGAT